MATISFSYPLTDGTIAYGSEVIANLKTIKNDYNGNIQNVNLATNAGITDSKLAQITTASKVSGAALTNLHLIPSGANVIPTANLPLTLTSQSVGFTIAGGTSSKTLTVSGDATLPLTSVGMPAGSVVQVLNTQLATKSTITTAFAYDDNIPQNTAGDEKMTLAITPTSPTNKLLIQVIVNAAQSGGICSMALFQDTTAGALAAGRIVTPGNNNMGVGTLNYFMTNNVGTSATTFKVRVGPQSGNTITVNGESGNRIYGGVAICSMTITEIVA
jgi:hypothetical protein